MVPSVKATAAILVGLACSLPAAAHADEADAERLFREGQKLMEEHRYGEACPKFADAYKNDAALGTLINLAFCHKEQGAIWYAWLEFREAEVKAIELSRADRRDFAHARLAELEKSASLRKVVIDNPRNVGLIDVKVEDRKVPEAERGAVFAAEAGSRKFTFRAKGKRPSTVLVTVTPTTKVQHVPVPEMADLTAEDLPPPPQAKKEPDAPAPTPRAPVDHTQRTIGWVGVGVGGGALAVGLAMGGVSLFGPCGHSACGSGERSFASTSAAISTVSVIGGGALVVTGIVLLLTAPSDAPSSSSARDRSRYAWPFVF